jgi:hypothetical protein
MNVQWQVISNICGTRAHRIALFLCFDDGAAPWWSHSLLEAIQACRFSMTAFQSLSWMQNARFAAGVPE